MKIAKLEISDKHFFEEIKKSINCMYYVECGLCGAIQIEAIELARVIHFYINHNEDIDNETYDYYGGLLDSIIESAPAIEAFDSYEEYQKCIDSYDRSAYHFLDDDAEYMSQKYGSYDEIIIFHDLNCNCFSKDKIDEEI